MKFFLLVYIVILLFLSIGVGCTQSEKKRNTYVIEKGMEEKLSSSIQLAIEKYLQENLALDNELKQLLQATKDSEVILDQEGEGFSFGEWRFEPKNSRFYHDGFQIGNEHTWYEVPVEMNGMKVKILTIEKKREHIAQW